MQAITDILIVPQFHYDIAYLKTEGEYLTLCYSLLQQAAQILKNHTDYRFVIEQPFLLERLATAKPDLFAQLQQLQVKGQLEVSGALYVIPDMNFPCGESLVRQVLYGRSWLRERFASDSTAAWIADSWGHPATLPGLLAHCGIETYFFSRGMNPAFQKGDFLWVGLDGTEMPAHWMPRSYGMLRFPDAAELETALEVARQEASEEGLTALVDALKPFLAQSCTLVCNGGDFAPPQKSAPAVVQAWQKNGLPVRFGLLSEYARCLTDHREVLPRYSGDFNPLFTGTQGSRILLKQFNRQVENLLISLERMEASLSLSGHELPASDRSDLWKSLLKLQFHDTISGTLVDTAYQEAVEEYEKTIETAEWQRDALIEIANVSGVFNPSGWERTEWVPALDGNGTAPVTVPPMGWAEQPRVSRAPLVSPPFTDPTTLENEFWQVTVGQDGTLTSVIDRATRREFVRPGGPGWGDLVYRADNGDLWLLDRSPLDGGSPGSLLTEAQEDDPYRKSADPLVNDNPFGQSGHVYSRLRTDRPGESTVVVTGKLGFWRNHVEFETRITLRRQDPLIYFETTLAGAGKQYRLYVCFPTPFSDAKALHSIPFGAVERDGRRYANQDWMEARGEGGLGVRLLNTGTAGCALNEGMLSLLLFRSVAMEYKGESKLAYEEDNVLRFRYAARPLLPENQGVAVWDGERLNRPFIVSTNLDGGLPAPLYLSTLPENVQLTAFYKVDAQEYLLRLVECAGKTAEGELSLAGGLSGAWRSDGMETRGELLPLEGGKLAFSLRPWQIASFRLRVESGQ